MKESNNGSGVVGHNTVTTTNYEMYNMQGGGSQVTYGPSTTSVQDLESPVISGRNTTTTTHDIHTSMSDRSGYATGETQTDTRLNNTYTSVPVRNMAGQIGRAFLPDRKGLILGFVSDYKKPYNQRTSRGL